MKVSEFVIKYYPYAKKSQDVTGISAVFTLAQAAIESGWGDSAPGNMFFGVKDTDGVNGNEQLLTTVEYSKNDTLKVPVTVSKTFDPIKKLYRFVVKDWFRKYPSPDESFTDHGIFFLKNNRYSKALEFKADPFKFAEAISLAGYATDPNYVDKLKSVISLINQYVK